MNLNKKLIYPNILIYIYCSQNRQFLALPTCDTAWEVAKFFIAHTVGSIQKQDEQDSARQYGIGY